MKLLTIQQLSEKIGFEVGSIYQMTSRKTIPHIKIGAKSLRFSEEAIDEWLAKKQVKLMVIK